MKTLLFWLLGLVIVSLSIGSLGTNLFVKKLRSHIKAPEGERISKVYGPVPAVLIGSVERMFFTVAVAFDISGTAVAMMAWIATKMLSNWHRPNRSSSPQDDVPISLSALLGSLVSMFFALIGGLICRLGM